MANLLPLVGWPASGWPEVFFVWIGFGGFGRQDSLFVIGIILGFSVLLHIMLFTMFQVRKLKRKKTLNDSFDSQSMGVLKEK